MLKPPVSVSMAFVRGMLQGVRTQGMPVQPFLDDAGIDRHLIDVASARVTGEQYVALFRSITLRLGDDGLGFFSRKLKIGCLALTMRAALGAPTLDVAARRIARTFEMLQDDVEVVRVREGRFACWGHRSVRLQPNFLHELLLRIFWRVLAWTGGGHLPVSRFDFAFRRPDYAASYAPVFPSRLCFDQAFSAFWFDAAALDRPVRRDEAALRVFFADAGWHIILPHRHDDALSLRVRAQLQHAREKWPDLTATASGLRMSTATLQRNLALEGTTFQTLKDELRRDIAIARLFSTQAPLSVLATELGFSDSAAFQRAFKAWTGSPPGAYRRIESGMRRNAPPDAL